MQDSEVKDEAKSLPIIKSNTLSGGLSGANASATNCGPRADPPIPTESIWVKRPLGEDGGLICIVHCEGNQYIRQGETQ